MAYSFLNQLSESKTFSSVSSLRDYTAEQLSELLVIHCCALKILFSYDTTDSYARIYTRRTLQYGKKFDMWASNATDLYISIFGLTNDVSLRNDKDSYRFKNRINLDLNLLNDWLRDELNGNRNSNNGKKLFIRLDYDLKISDSSIKAVRRLVQDWDNISRTDKKLVMTRLLQIFSARAGQSELLPFLEKVARLEDLELSNVCNKETGINCEPKEKNKKFGFLRSMFGLNEDATAGATSASGIATVVTALGSDGVAPDGDWGIYPKPKKKKKPIVIKRTY